MRRPLTVGSLFTGIGGFDLGLERAGHRVVWQVEANNQCRSVLRRHWPDVDLYEDVRNVGGLRLDAGRQLGHEAPTDDGDGVRPCPNDRGDEDTGDSKGGTDGGRSSTVLAPVDLICGGFPCQDLSVAGRREGLDGDRSGLWFEFHRIVSELAPTWVLIENVPGLLSSNDGRDFAVVLRGLAKLGYWWAYRVLDSQYFGVAQRRRRVFVLACNDPRAPSPAEVLAIPEGMSGHPAPSREAGAGVAASLTRGADSQGKGGYAGRRQEDDYNVVAHALTRREAKGPDSDATSGMVLAQTITAEMYRSGGATAGNNPGVRNVIAHQCHGSNVGEMGTLREGNGGVTGGVPFVACAFGENQRGETLTSDVHRALQTSGGKPGQGYPAALDAKAIPRRLTPTECERLQGFPDGWTEGQADSPRYRQMGNAVTVNVARWIGTRLAPPTTAKRGD